MDTPQSPAIDDLLIHGAWLRRLASNLVYEQGEAEDLVQETWLAALVRGPERREEARAWLARVLRNKAANRNRSKFARMQRERDSAPDESLPSTAVLAGRADMSRRLVELVLELPADQQRILLARYFEGLSSAEIARRLDRPHGSVRSQLKRGLDHLRTRLDAENEGEREKWLAALTPLAALPKHGWGVGAVLASSAGIKIAIGAALMLFATFTWLARRGPDSVVEPPPLVTDERGVQDTLQVQPPEHTGESLALEEVSPEAREAQIATEEVAVSKASPIEGRVVHPETGEAVVWFELGILPASLAEPFSKKVTRKAQMPEPEELERVRTDEQGRFVTQKSYESGSFALVPVEDWLVATPRMPQFRVRQPRAPLVLEHDAAEPASHRYELETGPVFVIDCPRAVELGAESMVAVYSYLDHFPPGYFRPSPLQVDPVPFVRMHTDYAQSHRKKAYNMRLVSVDGTWSGDIPMKIPDSIATQYVSFDLEARALVEIDLDFGGRHAPPVLELLYWEGAVDPEAEDVREYDIRELQATFDGTELEQAVVMYMRTGTATIAIKSGTSALWYRVVELKPGRNHFEAALMPRDGATGRIEGRVVHVEPSEPEAPVRVALSGDLNDEPLWYSAELEFKNQGGQWVADFAFTHLVKTEYAVFFDKGGPQTNDPATFVIEPRVAYVEPDGPPLEFEMHTNLTKTRLRISARDAETGKKIKKFTISAHVPGVWLNHRKKDTKTGRVTMNLTGSLQGGLVLIGAEGYLQRHVLFSEAEMTPKGLEVKAELQPGWGGPVEAQLHETYDPIAGVSVLLDGVEYGITDEKGQLHIHVPEAPKRMDFDLEGYEVVAMYGMIDNEGEVLPFDPISVLEHVQVILKPR